MSLVAIPYYRGFSFQLVKNHNLKHVINSGCYPLLSRVLFSTSYDMTGAVLDIVGCYPLLSRVLFSTDSELLKLANCTMLLSPIIAGSLFNRAQQYENMDCNLSCYPLLSRVLFSTHDRRKRNPKDY